MEGLRRNLLEILPLDVWLIIIDEVRKSGGSTRDVLNIIEVSDELLGLVMERSKAEWRFEQILPFVLPYLSRNDVLNCRSICKNWKWGLDNALGDLEAWRPFDPETSNPSHSFEYDPLKQKQIKWTHIEDASTSEEFLKWARTNRMKTSFVGRSLSLLGSNAEAEPDFLQRALEMLRLYGEHIWHLQIPFCLSPTFLMSLQKMLSYCPQLKSLAIQDEEFPEKESCDAANHLPSASTSIETLEFNLTSPDIPIFQQLHHVINLEKIKCLKLHLPVPAKAEMFALMTPFQHLTELHISWLSSHNHLEHIFNMISGSARMGKIVLDFGTYLGDVDFGSVCHAINRWGEQLRMLVIKGTDDFSFEAITSPNLLQLETLNLKSLEVDGIVFRPGFLPNDVAASLEYLRICYHSNFRNLNDSALHFYKDIFEGRNLQTSPIWMQMRNLKMIAVSCNVGNIGYRTFCTRSMHQHQIEPEIIYE